ncbi:hypothetical protein DMB68_20585 [Flavobacterium hydrophilum]|uniref:Uncharacterized protein n=1 Tax=Flavobacterium hydrophilum TaxID=2211445 RepID=A0A2V4BWQ1_9FLAO|nr:hypothetical protein DMB68_20585 [Flavobacterium hydrophilum]
MKKPALKILAFAIIISLMVIANMIVFRSRAPLFWIITFIISILILILFPYKAFFKEKNQK